MKSAASPPDDQLHSARITSAANVCQRCGRELGTGLPSPCPKCGDDRGKMLAEARYWDEEASRCARQNPVMLRKVIQHCNARAARLRQQVRMQDTLDGRDAA